MKAEYLRFIAALSKKHSGRFGNIWWYSLLHEKNTNKTKTYHNFAIVNEPDNFTYAKAVWLGMKKYLSFWVRHFLYRGTKKFKKSDTVFVTYGRYRGHFPRFNYEDGSWIYLPQKGGTDKSLENETAIDFFVGCKVLLLIGFMYIIYMFTNLYRIRKLKGDFTGIFNYKYFKEEVARSFFGDVLVEGLFYDAAFLRLFYTTPEIRRVIYVHEGVAWEKALVVHSRRNKGAVTIGLLCSCPALNEMNFFYDKSEADVMPLPDRIGVLGNRTYNLFHKMYGDRVFINGPMRFRYLEGVAPQVKDKDEGHILVVLPPDSAHAKELLDWTKIVVPILYSGDVKIVVKPHPSAPVEVDYDFSNWCSVYYGNDLIDFIRGARKVITASPSVCLIAAVLGVGVIAPTLKSYVSIRPYYSLRDKIDPADYFDFNKDERDVLNFRKGLHERV